MLHIIKQIIRESLDEALKDELPDYMIKAVKNNNPNYADKFLDMDVPQHTQLIPNVKIELNEPKIKQTFIKEIQKHFKESILNQYGETVVFQYFNDLKLAKIMAKSLNVSPKIILGLSDVSYLKVLYSKNFSLLQGKDNNIDNPIFSNNKSNLFTFIKSFNRAFPQYQLNLDEFLNDRIFVGLREPIMNFNENVKDLNKARLYLYISDKPADILRMSVSNFYTSCQNMYTGAANEQLLANVFDENSKLAYLIFDTPYIDNQGNKHPFTPIARTIIRVGKNDKIMFDVTYPNEMENSFYKIIEKYTNLKDEGTVDSYYPYKSVGLPPPYMDKYSIETQYLPLHKNPKAIALAKFLNIDLEKLRFRYEPVGDEFVWDGYRHIVYTENEANEQALDELRNDWVENEKILNTNFYDLVVVHKILDLKSVLKALKYDFYKKMPVQDFFKEKKISNYKDFEHYLEIEMNDIWIWFIEGKTYYLNNIVNYLGGIDKVRKEYIYLNAEEFKYNGFIIYKMPNFPH
jgi:hypothetical protein